MRPHHFLTAALLLSSKWAFAEPGFAEPPRAPLVVEDDVGRPREPVRGPWSPPSLVRLGVGPTLRFSPDATDGGLYLALDVGRGASGVRASAAWVRAGSDHGLSQYAAELWVDFGVGSELHPVLGAGAGVARLNHVGAESSASTVGIGTLRGTLEYVLPVPGADARAGVDLIGSVPAIRGSGAEDAKPWLLAVARVGVGF